MKNLILAFFLILTSLTVQAGNDGSKMAAEASDIARRMASQIELNELEYIQVRNYTLEKLEIVSTIQEMYQTNPQLLAVKLAAVDTNYTYRIQNLLNARQFENYLALSNSFKSQLTLIATSGE